MRRSRFTEKHTIEMLEQEAGMSTADVCRKHGVRARYGGLEVSDARRLKALQEENGKLKKLLAESMLEVSTLRDMLGKDY